MAQEGREDMMIVEVEEDMEVEEVEEDMATVTVVAEAVRIHNTINLECGLLFAITL